METDLNLEVYQRVINLFESVQPLDESLKNDIRNWSEVIHVRKKEKLIQQGETSKYIYFIYKGSIRSYYINNEGHENVSWLLFENELAIAVYSFFSQKPSFETLETLEDSILLRLSFERLNQLYMTYPRFNYIGRLLTELYYIRSEEKANALRMMTAKERYNNLLEQYPQVIQRVSLGHIASYLGITQHTLSRIRSQK